jgi:hypothetical protein
MLPSLVIEPSPSVSILPKVFPVDVEPEADCCTCHRSLQLFVLLIPLIMRSSSFMVFISGRLTGLYALLCLRYIAFPRCYK